MAVEWNLKKWLVNERNIYRPSELQALLRERAGVELSLTAISALINNTPNGIRFQTIQALCDALDCNLCDFCNVRPDIPYGARYRQRKVAGENAVRLYGSKEKGKGPDSIFPDPKDYATPKKPRGTSR